MRVPPIPWFALATLLACAATARAANGFHAAPRSLVAAGGGSSSGGPFKVTGAAGQAVAATKASYGSRYALAPGYWVGQASLQWPAFRSIETTRTPTYYYTFLTIAPARAGWVLQGSRDLRQWQDLIALPTHASPFQGAVETSALDRAFFFRMRRAD